MCVIKCICFSGFIMSELTKFAPKQDYVNKDLDLALLFKENICDVQGVLKRKNVTLLKMNEIHSETSKINCHTHFLHERNINAL